MAAGRPSKFTQAIADDFCARILNGVSAAPLVGEFDACVYVLVDPDTNAIRYVGQTRNFNKRRAQHCLLSNCKGETHRDNWLSSILIRGKKPKVIPVIVNAEWNVDERLCVSAFAKSGCDLVNGNAGGTDGTHMRIAKTSPNVSGRWSPLHRARQIIASGPNGRERSAVVHAAIKRAIKREGKSAALARINAELVRRNPRIFDCGGT